MMTDRVPCPLIVTHESANTPVPGHRWIAAFYQPTYAGSAARGDRRQVGWERLPTVFHGPSEEAVADAAASWWERQQDIRAGKLSRLDRALAARGVRRVPADA